MDAYCAKIRKLEKHFQGLEILHISRDLNVAPDVLARAQIGRGKVAPGVFVRQPGAITPKLPVPTTQILVVTPAQIGQGKVAPVVFIKQPDAITPELLAPTTQILVVVSAWTQVFINYIKELGSDRAKVPPGVLTEELSVPSIKQPGAVTPESQLQPSKRQQEMA